jgi:hypothetical protein
MSQLSRVTSLMHSYKSYFLTLFGIIVDILNL